MNVSLWPLACSHKFVAIRQAEVVRASAIPLYPPRALITVDHEYSASVYPPCGRQNECPQFASSAAHGLFHREHSGVVSVVERTNLREAEDPRNVVLFAQMRPLTLAGSSRASSSEDVAATSVRDPASELLREPRK